MCGEFLNVTLIISSTGQIRLSRSDMLIVEYQKCEEFLNVTLVNQLLYQTLIRSATAKFLQEEPTRMVRASFDFHLSIQRRRMNTKCV